MIGSPSFISHETAIWDDPPSSRVVFGFSEYPIGSMYGIFTYIYHKNQLSVDKYTIPMDPMGMELVSAKRQVFFDDSSLASPGPVASSWRTGKQCRGKGRWWVSKNPQDPCMVLGTS